MNRSEVQEAIRTVAQVADMAPHDVVVTRTEDGWTRVECMNPDCKDEEDRKPVAKLEYFEQEFVLRWQDDIIGIPA